MNALVQQFFTPITIKNRRNTATIILLIISLLYLSILQVLPTMLDPDGFFHAKMALLTLDQGFVSSFPYLPETILATYWTDQHWLYHVFLIPFVILFEPLWGVKIAAVFLGTFYILTFFFTLRYLTINTRASFWWSVLLLTAGPFIFRLILIKAQPLAYIFLLIGIVAFVKRKYLLLFVIQFFYVLAHGSFLLLPVLAIWILLFELLFNRRVLFAKRLSYMQSILAMLIGVVVGIIIQPTFPENIIFYWHQIVTIGIVGVSALEATGLEWRSISFIELIKSLGVLSLLTIVSIPFMVQFKHTITKESIMWAWLLIPFTILALKSIRNIEFLVPFLVITLALFWRHVPMQNIKKYITSNVLTLLFLGGIFSVSMVTWILYPMVLIFSSQERALPLTLFENEAKIINKIKDKPVFVINNRWDSWPMFFYYTDRAYFLTGLDPAFLYITNKEQYEALVEARESGNLDAIIESTSHIDAELFYSGFIIKGKPHTFSSTIANVMQVTSDEISFLYSIVAR